MLKIEYLSKAFGKNIAVDRISFEVSESDIFGFLGPNGAGKTTTISMIAGLLTPDSGQIYINSMNMEGNLGKIKRLMGVVPQEMAFYEELSAKENLYFWARLQGVKKRTLDERIQYYLEKTGLIGREKSCSR